MLSNSTNIRDVISRARGSGYRVKTVLWLSSSPIWGREPDEAALLGIDAADIREVILRAVLPDQGYLGLDEEMIINALDQIVESPGQTDCCLVYNIDLLIARLPFQSRDHLWGSLYRAFPRRRRTLVFLMPRAAEDLLPAESRREDWERDGRLAL